MGSLQPRNPCESFHPKREAFALLQGTGSMEGPTPRLCPRVPTHRAPARPILPPSSPSGVPISGLRPDSSSPLPLSPGLSQEGAKSSLGSKCPDGTSWANHCQVWGAQQGGRTHRPGHPQPGPGVCRCSGLSAAATAGNTMSPSFYCSIYHRTTWTRVPKSNSTEVCRQTGVPSSVPCAPGLHSVLLFPLISN